MSVKSTGQIQVRRRLSSLVISSVYDSGYIRLTCILAGVTHGRADSTEDHIQPHQQYNPTPVQRFRTSTPLRTPKAGLNQKHQTISLSSNRKVVVWIKSHSANSTCRFVIANERHGYGHNGSSFGDTLVIVNGSSVPFQGRAFSFPNLHFTRPMAKPINVLPMRKLLHGSNTTHRF